jgi:outer membrane protein OmpA-like peptidoglycan-associated protein
MRRRTNNRSGGDDGNTDQNIFVSMSDIFVGMLFIFLILMVYFALESGIKASASAKKLQEAQTKITHLQSVIQNAGDEKKTRIVLIGDIRDLEKMIKLKNAEIDKLKSTIVIWESDLNDATKKGIAKKNELDAYIEELIKKLKRCEEKIEKLEWDVKMLEKRVKTLEKELDRLRKRFQTPVTESRNENKSLPQQITSGTKKEGVGAFVSGEDRIVYNQKRGWFQKGRWTLRGYAKADLDNIAKNIPAALECYVLREDRNRPEKCKGNDLISSFNIESHTQKETYFQKEIVGKVGESTSNMEVSAMRAAEVYRYLTEENPDFLNYKNHECRPIFGVVGYGGTRPRNNNPTQKEDRTINPRIAMQWVFVPESKVTSLPDRCPSSRRHLGG